MAGLAVAGRRAAEAQVLRGAEEGTSQDGEQEPGHPGPPPQVLHTPWAVIKGDTASLRKDSQSPLNL